MPFSDLPEHLLMPAMRPMQPIPLKKDNKPFIMLRDPFMLSKESVIVPPNVFSVIQRIDGNTTAEDIVAATNAPADQFVKLLQQLDIAGLLWGPTSKQLEIDKLDEVSEKGTFPIRSTAPLGATAADCHSQITEWFDSTEDPEIDQSVKAIIAPHLDYDRGWPNYASAYYAWKDAEPPKRVVILGTNHFGNGDGVVLSTLGFSSPMGTCPVDTEVVQKLEERLGEGSTIDQIDHLAEHSIELHLPWLQYCFGDVPVVAALIPSPLVDMIEDDDARTTTEEFIQTLKSVLNEVGGKTFVVSSADLSHVGRQFGEPRPVDEQRRFDVERHDREMMSKFIANDAQEFISAMKWNNNATQWCSIGNMSATLMLTEPDEIELIDYRQACDDKGNVLVSSCAMVLI